MPLVKPNQKGDSAESPFLCFHLAFTNPAPLLEFSAPRHTLRTYLKSAHMYVLFSTLPTHTAKKSDSKSTATPENVSFITYLRHMNNQVRKPINNANSISAMPLSSPIGAPLQPQYATRLPHPAFVNFEACASGGMRPLEESLSPSNNTSSGARRPHFHYASQPIQKHTSTLPRITLPSPLPRLTLHQPPPRAASRLSPSIHPVFPSAHR